ncbi:MAG: ribonuclease R [Candidatus Peribacteria bacterium]|nr:MAG: ribonuclease R [Candidatus Peribacteria bacterium]
MSKKDRRIQGIYRQHSSGNFGFIDVEEHGEKKGYFVYPLNRKDALDGDTVDAYIKEFHGKEEAEIISVLTRTDRTLVGTFTANKGQDFGFVTLKNTAFSKDIFIGQKNIGKAKSGDVVGVKILEWKGKNPSGKIVEIVGKVGDKHIDVEGYILEAGFANDFPEAVQKAAKKYKTTEVKVFKRREDLRSMFTFTIDGDDAKDLDDAISIKKKENGDWKLYVHIADVSEYVKEGSEMDEEALKRGTSVYLVDRVLPMLPRELSNGVCSLNPKEDKLTLTCEMTISKDGEVTKQKVYESVINSNYRLTYKFVQDLHDGTIQDIAKDEQFTYFNRIISSGAELSYLKEVIENAYTLKAVIEKNKQDRGVLDFDFPETKIVLDANHDPEKIARYPMYESNKIIAEFMILANEAVSSKFSNIPFVYRVHDEPDPEDVQKLNHTLHLFNIPFALKKVSTKEFSRLLGVIAKSDKKYFLEKTLLRSLAKAMYSDINRGHFGLGSTYYSHFTSPIRRYPDLQIHRIIKEKLQGKLEKDRIWHYKSILRSVSERSSEQEIKADDLEYKVRDYFVVQFYKDKVGQEFEGFISGMIKNGFFVQLPDTSEGMVEYSKDFEYSEDKQEYYHKPTKHAYKVGDIIKVILEEADEVNVRLRFSLVFKK